MNTTDSPNQEQPKQAKFVSPWLAYPLAFLVWGVIPWVVSFLSRYYGWTAGRPGIWNLLGLIPVLIGAAGLFWGIALHAAQSPKGLEWELDRSYLLKGSMYRFSRNPMYLSELILMFGWVSFYGSIPVLIVLIIWYLFFNYYQMPLEERILEARFGDAYRQYKSQVPRWIGKSRSP